MSWSQMLYHNMQQHLQNDQIWSNRSIRDSDTNRVCQRIVKCDYAFWEIKNGGCGQGWKTSAHAWGKARCWAVVAFFDRLIKESLAPLISLFLVLFCLTNWYLRTPFENNFSQREVSDMLNIFLRKFCLFVWSKANKFRETSTHAVLGK